jgi:integrase
MTTVVAAHAVGDMNTWLNKRLGKHATHVFSYRGVPITQVSTKAWYAALDRAGIKEFRWHDLRHTWASWHVQQGTPLFALQELGGWESAEMVRRYAHLAADHLVPYAERPRRQFRRSRHKLGTGPKNKRLASLQAVELLVAGTRILRKRRLRIR